MANVVAVSAWPFSRLPDGSLPSGATVTDRQYGLINVVGSDGVFNTGADLTDNPSGGSGGRLAVTAQASPNMTVNVAEGRTKMQGLVLENATLGGVNLDIATAPSVGLTRYDLIVARVDWTAKAGYLAVLTGTPATTGTQVAPTPTKSNTLWEQPLALVSVAAGTGTITNSLITDWRMYGGARNLTGKRGTADMTAVALTATLQTVPQGAAGGTAMQIALTTDGRPVVVTGGAAAFSATGGNPTLYLSVDIDGTVYVLGSKSQSDAASGEQMAAGELTLDGGDVPLLAAGRHVCTLKISASPNSTWGLRAHRWLRAWECK